ncbi:hypothetical protein CCR75_006376 [Bremia lactucae]|nr:hypothetical protein CCR75_006376 [Bremia lactucae]
MGFICPECKIKFLSADQLEAHYTKTHSSFASIKRESDRLVAQQSRSSQETQQSTTHTRDIHATFLSDLAPQLAELKDQSLALSDALDLHHMGLDRLDTKVGQVHHDMKQVERQAHKIMGRTIPAVFRFRCAIQEAKMDKFLCTKNGDAVLSDVTKMASSADVVVDGCTFRAYTLGDDSDVWGFQCEKTSRFVGINRYGNLKVQGVEFHSYEQFLVEAKSTTTIFCLSSYFGLGGWIAMKDLGTTSKLTIIRGTPENKAFAAQFRIVPV